MIGILIVILIMSCASFEFPFTVIDNFITSNICIGTPKQCFCVLMDTGSPFLWVPHVTIAKREKLTFDQRQSSTFKEYKPSVSYRRDFKKVYGREVSDLVTIHAHELEASAHIKWALVTEMEYYGSQFDGIFGFTRDQSIYMSDSSDVTYNYLDSLQKKQVIEHKTLGFKFDSLNKGLISIGNPMPSKGFSKCYSNDMKDSIEKFGVYWNCEISSIIYANSFKTIPMTQSQFALFVTGERRVLIPKTQAMLIFSEYEKMSNNKCSMAGSDTVVYLKCNSEQDIELLESIELALGSVILTLNPKDLFSRAGNEYLCSIKSIPYDSIWVIGEPVLRNYHTVFDFDSNTISFSLNSNEAAKGSSNNKRNAFPKSKGYFWNVILIIFSLLIVGCVIFVLIKKIRLHWLIKKGFSRPMIDYSTDIPKENSHLGV